MNENLRSQSKEKMINAIEGNLFAWIPFLGILGKTYFDNPPGVKRSITNLPISLFNSVMGAQFAPNHIDPSIQVIVSDAKMRNVPILWWISPSTQPTDLGERLVKYGFNLDETSPGMAIELEELNESLPKPEGLSIQLVQDDATRRQWSIVMNLGFGAESPNDLSVNAWCSILRQTNPDALQAYIGWLGKKPVATSLLFMAAGAAGIYAVATIPEARRKGIGAMLTQYPLIQARSKGYKIGILQSSELGLPVYRSLGFQTYCNIDTYIWKPEKQDAS